MCLVLQSEIGPGAWVGLLLQVTYFEINEITVRKNSQALRKRKKCSCIQFISKRQSLLLSIFGFPSSVEVSVVNLFWKQRLIALPSKKSGCEKTNIF